MGHDDASSSSNFRSDQGLSVKEPAAAPLAAVLMAEVAAETEVAEAEVAAAAKVAEAEVVAAAKVDAATDEELSLKGKMR